ncbi:TPA: hypothetical protein DCE37_24325 [Candidatus Latescibacteria bacterium]|nr:hypothetical protein [Candidatus Latescibacterota bacterium]
MNKNQIVTLSAALPNLGVGILLIGAIGPIVVKTNLRHGFWLSSIVSSVMGLAAIGLSVYLRRD